jgi:hypothetical protein
MILYTMMPEELIYPTGNEDYLKQKMVEINGISVLVNETSPGEHYIVRILSCNPEDYLNDQFTPGQRIVLS